jgi:hypothetical protein
MEEVVKKINKDKLTSEQIGEVFVEILKGNLKLLNEKDLDNIMNLVDQLKPKVSADHIRNELFYLDVYIIYKALFSRFKGSFDEIEKSFKKELEKFIKEGVSESEALTIMIGVTESLVYYMQKSNDTIELTKPDDSYEKLAEFSRCISNKVIGDDVGDDIRYVMYMSNYYTSKLIGFVNIIDDTIDLVS